MATKKDTVKPVNTKKIFKTRKGGRKVVGVEKSKSEGDENARKS